MLGELWEQEMNNILGTTTTKKTTPKHGYRPSYYYISNMSGLYAKYGDHAAGKLAAIPSQ